MGRPGGEAPGSIDTRQPACTTRGTPVHSPPAPHEGDPHVVLVGDGEDPEGDVAAELPRLRADGQVCRVWTI